MKEMSPYLFQGFVALSMGVVWAISPKVPKLAVVDVNALISAGSQRLAKDGRPSSHEVREWGTQLKEGLETFGQDRGLVLLAKGAVVGSSLPDVTGELLGLLEAEEK